MWTPSLRSARHVVVHLVGAECIQVLRKYSDKTVARDLVGELESYGGDPANLVHSGMPSSSQPFKPTH